MGARAAALRAASLVLVASTLVASGCGAPLPARERVVARAGDATATLAEGAGPAPLKLGSETRPALAAPPDAELRLSVPPEARRLRFAVGAGAQEGAAGAVTFEVLGDGGEKALFAETVAADSQWRVHTLPLPEPPAQLRLRARPNAAAARAGVESHFASVAFLGPEPAREGGGPAKPNVLLLSLDTLGARDLGRYGQAPGVSPTIEGFLEEAFAFDRAYAQYPNTLVSHASLFSSLNPGRLHLDVDSEDRWAKLVANQRLLDESSLVGALAERGYLTAAVTENGFVSALFGFAAGFDAYEERSRDAVAGHVERTFEEAARWLERFGTTTRFFLFVHTYKVHTPYLPHGPEARRLARRLGAGSGEPPGEKAQTALILRHNAGERIADEETIHRLEALHLAEVHELDRALEAFLERLEALGLSEDTLVVLTSDHGEEFGESGHIAHGESLHNRVLHVPLAFRWPGRVRPGESDVPVALVDLMPTVLDLAGIEAPAGVDGRSLADALTGAGPAEGRAVFSELRNARGGCRRLDLPNDCRLERYAVQTGRFKLVSSAKPPYEHLYDLEADPAERRDVSASEPEALARHRELLQDYRARAGEAGAPRAEPHGMAADGEIEERLRALGYLE